MSFTQMHNDYLDPDRHLWEDDGEPPMKRKQYKILWDNGHACDEFPQVFTNKKEAQSWGVNWKREMVLMEPESKRKDARQNYSFEVVEITTEKGTK